MISLVIVDDHQVVIDGLKVLLMSAGDIKVIGSANNGSQLFKILKNKEPDIIILDLVLPQTSGIDVLKQLQKSYQKIKIIVYTGNTPEDMIVEALENGALGILPKNSSQEELINAIRAVSQGYQYFGEKITHSIIRTFIHRSRSKSRYSEIPPETLTKREQEIVKLFAEGHTYKEIAYKLNISTHTVESHKVNILNKLNLKTIIDLVKYAIKYKFIEI
jgi:DNA-binding NarL/FixJ family response regulator